MISLILISLAVSFFLSIMLLAVIIPFKPDSLKIFGKFVCQGDEKIEVSHSTASYHQPGERSIHIYCNDYGKHRSVKAKILLLSFIASFLLILPLTVLAVFFISRQF